MEKNDGRPIAERRNMTKRSESQKAMVTRQKYLNSDFKPTLVEAGKDAAGATAAKDKTR